MVVLGLGFTDHEASAALVVDGELKAAIARERLTRLKKDGIKFGSRRLDLSAAAEYCIEQNGLAWSDVDLIAWNHIDHLSEDLLTSLLEKEGSGFFGIPTLALPHHFAHACATFYLSPFSDAAVLVADGTGGPLDGLLHRCAGPEPSQLASGAVVVQNFADEDTGTALELESFYFCDGENWNTLRKVAGHYGGIGARYGAVSSLLFDNPLDAGKTMGLAQYGSAGDAYCFLEPTGPEEMRAYRAVRGGEWDALKGRLKLWRTGSALRNLELNYEDSLPSGCAAVMQREAEEALLEYARWLRSRTSSPNLCLGGGVALNCVANSRVALESGFERVFVPPAPGDDGIAAGCALYGAAVNGDSSPAPRLRLRPCPVYLGRTYGHDEDQIRAIGLAPIPDVADIAAWVAQQIAGGAVVGWYQCGAELGPRALGHRSFLADPRDPRMRDHLNNVVKNREPFRPFAPVVQEERVLDYFEESFPSYYMSFVATVRKDKRGLVPAITHVDGTARYQVLRRPDNPQLYGIIEAFGGQTGIPMLLNTSFNRAGEPIVETPEQAARCVLSSSADVLVLDGRAYANPRWLK